MIVIICWFLCKLFQKSPVAAVFHGSLQATRLDPAIDSPEFQAGFQSVVSAIDSLQDLFDTYEIGRLLPGPLDDNTVRYSLLDCPRSNEGTQDATSARDHRSRD